jgi:excisionase family DNA binding protein
MRKSATVLSGPSKSPPSGCAGRSGSAIFADLKIVHLDPSARGRTSQVTEEIDRLLAEGKRVAVTVAEEQELFSPQQAADRLGFSRQHVVRLISYGELEAHKLPGSEYWKIPLTSVLAFEERRDRARELAAEWSRDLDAMGAPPE